ncbi:MAG TPA: DUF2231 domain-containing protein [Tepidiformaceae bacterium]|nr:DUF2231 domain-containing protein [Tepidiformaceae bacterium]
MFLQVRSVAGVPAHPLVVHAAVILVPLAAIGILATGWRPAWRKPFAIPLLAIALAGAIFAIVAVQTGEPLEHDVRDAARNAGVQARFGDHPEQGETAQVFAIILAAATAGYAGVVLYGERMNLPSWSGTAAYGAVLIPALLATGFMIVAGHSGAQLVWKDVGSFAAGG